MHAVAATSVPLLKDLHQHITPHYATHWNVIGAQLDMYHFAWADQREK